MFSGDDKQGISFFERLGADTPPVGYERTESIEYVIASIKRNISGLLNTRIGESQSCPELGLPDFNDVSSGSLDLGMQIKAGIKACIERFEPRISDVDVQILHDDSCTFSLRFHVCGRINVKSKSDKIDIDLLLDSNRAYRVS